MVNCLKSKSKLIRTLAEIVKITQKIIKHSELKKVKVRKYKIESITKVLVFGNTTRPTVI